MAHPISSNKASVQETPFSDYTLQRECGEGTNGTVYQAQHNQNKVALKFFKASSPLYATEKKELEMLNACLGLPHMLQVLGWGTTKGRFFIVTDVHTPLKIEKKFDFPWIQKISRGLFKAIEGLHGARITHTDIKPQNCLVNAEGDVVLADLGSAIFSDDDKGWPIQTVWYRDPRVFIKAPYDHTIDLWSMGCLLSELALGEPLFHGQTHKDFSDQTFVRELHTMHLITQLLGMPPDTLIFSGDEFSLYFYSDPSLRELPSKSHHFSAQKYDFDTMKASCIAHAADKSLTTHFVSLIGRLVTYGEKISATGALASPFFSSKHTDLI